MRKFSLDESDAIQLIEELQKMIDGNIYDKAYGICGNILLAIPGKVIDYNEIFTTLGYKDWAYPIGGHEEFSGSADKWKGKSLVKRVALCKQMKKLMRETFNIKD